MKGGLARQRFRERQRRRRIIGQLDEMHAAGYSADEIRAAGPNAYRTLMQGAAAPTGTAAPAGAQPYSPAYIPALPQPSAPAPVQGWPSDYDYSYSRKPWYIKYPSRISDTVLGTVTGSIWSNPTLKEIWNIKQPSAPQTYAPQQAVTPDHTDYSGAPVYQKAVDTALSVPAWLYYWIRPDVGKPPTFKQIWKTK